ncbi:MAG: hypothetical protein R2881_03895 [Eubacteriales bacterium]
METSVGGVTRNILENLARQGVAATLLYAVSDDVYGEKIVRDSLAAGIDMSRIQCRHGVASSSYIALDERGDMLLGMSDMRIMRFAARVSGRKPCAVLQGGCNRMRRVPSSRAAGPSVTSAAGTTPVMIDPVSTAYARQMEPLAEIFAIKPNEMELSILSGMPAGTEDEIERACEAAQARYEAHRRQPRQKRLLRGCRGKPHLRALARRADGKRDRRGRRSWRASHTS